MHLQFWYFFHKRNTSVACMTELPGAWMQEASAEESQLQGKKEMVMVLTSTERPTKSLLLPIFSSVCQSHGDNNIKWKQKSSCDDVNPDKMAGKKESKIQRHQSVMPWELVNAPSLLWSGSAVDLRIFSFFLMDILPGEASKGPDRGSTNMQDGYRVQGWLRSGHWCDQD